MKFPNDPVHPLLSFEETIAAQLVKNEPLHGLPTIPEFYGGQEIFITGGSGFLGKVLIEKLLRSCPDIKTIYVLLRVKKGQSIEERLKGIVDLPLFDVLRAMKSNFLEKLVPIAGDVGELKLGLSDETLTKLSNVSMIFHSAATVRFDDSLKYSVLINTRGTREVMEFAETLKNIKLVMHISTTYSNVHEETIEERLYPAIADWKKTIEICEKLDEDYLNLFTQHFINFMPNTYVFSKHLAEHVAHDFKDRLPLVMLRPSVVIGAMKDPLPGWVDNLNGPMGILLASLIGLSKTMICDPKNVLDMIPVDVCCKSIIIASWKRSSEPKGSFPVYNCACGEDRKVTIEQMLEIGIHGVCYELPLEHQVWQAGGGVTTSKNLNLIRLIFYQILPAIFFDAILKLKKQNPRLLQLQRKMYEANKALSYFVTHNWTIKTDNLKKLCSNLNSMEDIRAFDFGDMSQYDTLLVIRYNILGYRRYLLKEKDDSLPQCRKNYKRIEIANNILKSIPYLILIYLLFFKYDIINLFKGFFDM